jgi:hypothetical protein
MRRPIEHYAAEEQLESRDLEIHTPDERWQAEPCAKIHLISSAKGDPTIRDLSSKQNEEKDFLTT